MHRALFAGCLLAIAAAGCGGDDDGSVATAVARFDPETMDGAPLAVAAVPFPSDLYLDAGGHPRVGALLENDDDPRTIALRGLLAHRVGLCGTCNAYFGIDGDLDPESVPASAGPTDAGSAGDPIVMADVTDGSPERGRLFALRVEHDAADGILAVRPVRGVALHRGRTYAIALTDAVRSANGSPLAASPAFLEVRDGSGGSPAVARARTLFDPALDVLAELGVARERVVDLAVFTAGDPTEDLRAVRALVHAAPAPVAVVDRVWATPEALDELMGVVSEDEPGVDVAPLAGTDGTRAMRHATVAAVVAGRFQAPRMIGGSGTELGEPLRGADGALTAGEQQDVPFVLIVPAGVDLSTLPVVVHHHGFNASRITGFVYADTAGAAGAAVLSIDGFQHGDRAASHRDEIHNLRGTDGPDGFAETDTLAVSGQVFGVTGAPPGMELYPGYPLGAFLQFDADVMAAIRLVREGDVSAVAAADPSLAALRFDADRVLYAGNSMGAVVGAGVLTAESDVVAYALNVQPGSMVETLAEGAEFRGLSESVFLPVLGVRGRFDEVTRHIVFHPTIDLFRWAMEPVDPLALAPYLVTDRVAGGEAPDVLVQLASLDEVAAPSASQSMIAAAGIPGSGDFALAPIAPATLPLRANAASGATAGVVQHAPGAHGMLEVHLQESRYEPGPPPFVERPEPIPVDNPVAAVHAQIEAFFESRLSAGRAEIR